ncbi:MAG TPA: GTP-binding protein [Anaerolineae bacterium]|nr:GTP-binding protein [Anaerolineae bacterium]
MDENLPSKDRSLIPLGEGAQRIWDDLPNELREKMSSTLDQLPGDMKGWRRLIDRAVDHVRLVVGRKRIVAIVGPINAGKSTLYNHFVRSKTERARVSAVPGTTREAQQADAGIFMVVDTPGADVKKDIAAEERLKALRAAMQADVLVVIFDASHGVLPPQQELFDNLRELGKPMVVGLNKIDLVRREVGEVVNRAAVALNIPSEEIVPLSALTGKGVEKILTSVASLEPEIVAALGAALPEYRGDLCQVVIARAASTAAVIAMTPLPFLDFIPLVAVQTAMVMTIARIHAYKITLSRARELIATFGLGFLGRTLFHELSKLGGPPGWMVAAAVAAGTTTAMGYAAATWFERGERLQSEALRRISRRVSEQLVGRLRSLGSRRRRKSVIREQVTDTLSDFAQQNRSSE